jgi:hypothetical protein
MVAMVAIGRHAGPCSVVCKQFEKKKKKREKINLTRPDFVDAV